MYSICVWFCANRFIKNYFFNEFSFDNLQYFVRAHYTPIFTFFQWVFVILLLCAVNGFDAISSGWVLSQEFSVGLDRKYYHFVIEIY